MDFQDEFTGLAERHQRSIYTFAYYFLGDAVDAQDIAQEVLVKLWRHRAEVDPNRLKAWTLQVTRNCCVDLIRRRSRRQQLVSGNGYEAAIATAPDGKPDPAESTVRADLLRQIQAAMERLGEPYKSVVVMREIQQLSYNEISEILEMPLNTVKSHLHRGRRMLRESLPKELVHGLA